MHQCCIDIAIISALIVCVNTFSFIYLFYGFFSHAGIAFFIHKISTVLTVESSQLSDAQNVIFTHISRDFLLSRLASPIVICYLTLTPGSLLCGSQLTALSPCLSPVCPGHQTGPRPAAPRHWSSV